MIVHRRSFITLLGGAAAAWPLAARAQQGGAPVIGFLCAGSPNAQAQFVAAFHQGLNETGYVEHRNVGIEYRWAEGQYDRLPAMAAELVRRQATVIITTGGFAAVQAAKAATTTTPIVFQTGVDPVEIGLVASLARPGGNLTGATTLAREVGQKRLELLHELVPAATVVAVLINPTNPGAESQSKDMQAAARTLGLQLHVLHASTEREFDRAFATLAQLQARALVINSDAFFTDRSEQLAALTLRHAVPAIHLYRAFVAAGGLMSYAGSITDVYRIVGNYTGRILKGEKPADLPVQRSTKVELVINMKTAKALGITFPLTILGRADEVIE